MIPEPLIWTSKGNLPERSLRYEHQWEDTPNEVTLHERWFDGDELVKNNVHKLARKGLSFETEQAHMG